MRLRRLCQLMISLNAPVLLNNVLHFGRAAVIPRVLQVEVMEELTGAQLIAEALKAQVSVIIQKCLENL